MSTTTTSAAEPTALPRPVVSREEWLAARRALLAAEKRITRLCDELARTRRELPWVKIDKGYTFDTPTGKRTLADLFEHRSQLIVYHFMFAPGWKEGCVGCSFLVDHIDGALTHLENHDVSLVCVSRAPLAELAAFKKRMGWKFPWVSSHASDFNYDFHASFTPEEIARGRGCVNFEAGEVHGEETSGLSVFFKDARGDIYHTYSCYERGGEPLINTYNFLDLTPRGRNENGPQKNLTDWVRHHDRYGAPGHVDATGRYRAEPAPRDPSAAHACSCEAGCKPG